MCNIEIKILLYTMYKNSVLYSMAASVRKADYCQPWVKF